MMVMHKYEIILYWSKADGAFVAEVPEAMDLWIDTAREYGDPIPEPKGSRLLPA